MTESQSLVTCFCSVALSTAEAEYIAVSTAAQEAIWLRQLINELSNSNESPILIFEDNQSAIAMARNPQFHGHAKHNDIRHHYVREQVSKGSEYYSTVPVVT